MERLHKSCRKLIWLNPLLRYEGFEPRPAGVRAMLPHVDAFLPAHNLDSLVDLARALSERPTPANDFCTWRPRMEMTGEQLIPLPQQRVWEALNDPEILKACIPGLRKHREGLRHRVRGRDERGGRSGEGASSTAS